MIFSRKKRPEKEPLPLANTVPPETEEGKSMTFLAANLQGIGKRENQEDSFAFGNDLDRDSVNANGLLAVVADGMGGLAGGKQASETAIATILRDYENFDLEEDISRQLEDAVFHANDSVIKALSGAGGSTVVAALIYKEKLYYCSVGDSYVFLLRDRVLIRLNRSHNVEGRTVLDGIYVGDLDPEAGAKADQREAVTHFLGLDGLDETDLLRRPMKLMAGDVLLLCSDGIGGALSYETIEKCLSHGVPADMCRAMEAAVKAKNHPYQDNYTALVIQCRKP